MPDAEYAEYRKELTKVYCYAALAVTFAVFLVLIVMLIPTASAAEINPSVENQPIFCKYTLTKFFCNSEKPGPQGITGPQGEKGEQNYSLMAWNITNSTLTQNITNAWNVSSSVINSNYTYYGGTEINESYAYLPGREGGQTLNGGTTTGNLVLNGSANNGDVFIQPNGGTLRLFGDSAVTGYDMDSYSTTDTALSMRLKTIAVAGGSNVYLDGNTSVATITGGAASALHSFNNGVRLGRVRFITNGALNSGGFTFLTVNAGGTETERFRISAPGNVSIGTTAPTAQFDTTGTVRFRNYGAGTATFDAGGNITSVSDPKLKTLITPYTGSIAKIQAITPITYKWKPESGYDTANTYTGFDAANLKTAIPEAVFTKEDTKYVQEIVKGKSGEEDEVITKEVKTGTTTMSISDRAIIAALVNAVKEQQTQITALQQENKKQEERITALEKGVKL